MGWVLNPFEELGKVSVVEVGNTIVLVKSIGAPHLWTVLVVMACGQVRNGFSQKRVDEGC